MKNKLRFGFLLLTLLCVGFPFNHALGLYYSRMVPSVPHSNSVEHYSFNLPPAWEEIPKSIIDKKMDEVDSQTKTKRIEYVAGFHLVGSEYFEYPYILVQKHDVKTPSFSQFEKKLNDINFQEKLDRKADEYSELIKVSSTEKPFIDKERNIIFMNMQAGAANGIQFDVLVAMFFGKNGITQFNYYSTKKEYSAWFPTFYSITDSFKYDDGFAYNSVEAEKNDEIPLSEGVVDESISGLVMGMGMSIFAFAIILIVWFFRKLGKKNEDRQ